jgi:large subunit ribosomal protein L24
MILDPKTNTKTRIGARLIIDEKTGKKKSARISRSSGEMIA